MGHADPLHRPGGGAYGAGKVSRAHPLPCAGDDPGGGRGEVPEGAGGTGAQDPVCGGVPPAGVARPGCGHHLHRPGGDLPGAGGERDEPADLVQPGAGGTAAAPERGGGDAAGAAGGIPALEWSVPDNAGTGPAGSAVEGGIGGPDGPGVRGHPVARGCAGPSLVGAPGGAVLAPGADCQHRAAEVPGAGGGPGGSGERGCDLRYSGPPAAARRRGGQGHTGRDRAGSQRQAVGLRCLRICHLPAICGGGGGGQGHAEAVPALPGAAGGGGPGGGGGGRPDGIVHLPGAPGPAFLRNRAEPAEWRDLCCTVPGPGPLQAGKRHLRPRSRERDPAGCLG